MAKRFLLDQDGNAIKEFLIHDEVEQLYHIHRKTDLTDTIEDIVKRANDYRPNPKSDMRYKGEIPIDLLIAWGDERHLPRNWFYKNEYQKELDRFMADPDHKKLRFWKGN